MVLLKMSISCRNKTHRESCPQLMARDGNRSWHESRRFSIESLESTESEPTCGIKRSLDRSRRRRQDVIATVTWREQLQRMMPLRRIPRSRPASFSSPFCKSNRCQSDIQGARSAVVDGAHEILAVQWGLRHIVQQPSAWYMYSVLCTYIQSTLRSSLDPTLENAPRRPGLFLLCASQLERPSRVGFVPFFHRYVSHTCSQASWSKSRRDRCAGMLEGMRACVRLASRTRFGVAHAHGICTNALLR
jgi:hypothetical protein